MPGAGKHKKNATLYTPVYDAQALTLTWPDVPLKPGCKRSHVAYVKVALTATSPLVFQAACPNDSELFMQSNVTVRDALVGQKRDVEAATHPEHDHTPQVRIIN